MLNQRRKLLAYLRRDNFPRYAFVLHKLGLKDTYAKQVREAADCSWASSSSRSSSSMDRGGVMKRALVVLQRSKLVPAPAGS